MAGGSYPVANVATASRAGFSARDPIVLGVVLAFLGILAPAGPLGAYVLMGPVVDPDVARWVIAAGQGLYATGSILFGLGGFLIFMGFARIRPDSKPWTSLAAPVVLASGVAGAILHGAWAWAAIALPRDISVIDWFNALAMLQFASGAASGIALVTGLYGLARALTSAPPVASEGSVQA